MRLSKSSRIRLEQLKKDDPNQYQDVLARLVEKADIYETPGQALTASAEVFEDAVTGDLVSPEQLVKSLAQIPLTETPESVVIGFGYNNAAAPSHIVKGKYKGDINVNKSPHSANVPAMRVKDVERWAADQLARAFVDPNSVSANEAINLQRAAAMGRAASTGNGAAMIAANKRYDISDEYVDEFLKYAKIGDAGFESAIRKSGLQGREEEVIDPVTGKKVVELEPAEEKAFYHNRALNLTKSWLQSGGRGLNNLRDEIGIPGEEYQMEHNYPFSQSNASGFAETPDNRVGFLRRYVNSEKNDIDPRQYYQQQRLAYLANQQGIDVTGVLKGQDNQEVLESILEKANPTEVVGDRRKKDYKVERFPEREVINQKLVSEAMQPQDQAQNLVDNYLDKLIRK